MKLLETPSLRVLQRLIVRSAEMVYLQSLCEAVQSSVSLDNDRLFKTSLSRSLPMNCSDYFKGNVVDQRFENEEPEIAKALENQQGVRLTCHSYSGNED